MQKQCVANLDTWKGKAEMRKKEQEEEKAKLEEESSEEESSEEEDDSEEEEGESDDKEVFHISKCTEQGKKWYIYQSCVFFFYKVEAVSSILIKNPWKLSEL